MPRRGSRARCFGFVLLATILLAAPLPAAPEYVPDEVIVKFRPGTSASAVAAIRADLGATVKSELTLTGAVCLKLTGVSVEDAVAKYGDDPAVEYLEPNYLWRADLTPDDPGFGDLWGLHNDGQTGGTVDADIDAPEAWESGTGSSDVVVAVIDTGVDFSHPDLAANRWINPGEIAGNGVDDDLNGFVDDINGYDFVNDDGDPADDHSHGTHCSGTIGAVGDNGIGVVGVCWRVRIMALKFLDESGNGSNADAILAVGYAVRMGADILSNSWGGEAYSAALRDAIGAAGAAGVLFVAAAGNSSSDNDFYPHYPASYDLDNIVAVAATDHNDQLAVFSCWGAQSVDLAAPGVDILSTVPGAYYDYKSGTSMACPHVSGALALIKARFPGITGPSARTLLLNNVSAVPALAGLVATGGRLNVAATMAGPDSIAPAAISDLSTAGVAGQWVDLTWTATGDDGAIGTASAYELRFATFPIDSLNFAVATPVTDVAVPHVAGTGERHRVQGLAFETDYWFAIRARDEYGLASPVVGAAMATTAPPPVITMPTATLAAALYPGGTDTRTLTIGNTGQSELVWSAAVVAADTLIARARGARFLIRDFPLEASAPVGPGPNGAAATPPFGKRVCSREAQVGGEPRTLLLVTYDPENSAYGTALQNLGLGYMQVTTWDEFEAEMAASAWDLVIVDNYYWWASYTALDQILAHLDGGGALIFADWSVFEFSQHELMARLGVSYESYFTTPQDILAVDPAHRCFRTPNVISSLHPSLDQLEIDGQLVNTLAGSRRLAAFAAFPQAGAIVLDESGRGVFNAFQSANYGIDGDSDGVLDIVELLENEIAMVGLGAAWLRVEPDEGVVAAGATQDVTVTFDATGLCGGAYAAGITVSSNDPVRPELVVPGSLDVIGESDIALVPLSFAFGTRFVGAVVVDTLTVANAGCEPLVISGVSSDQAEFSVTPTGPFTLAPGRSRPVVVTYVPVTLGAVAGTLTIVSDDPDEPSVVVALSGAGAEPPVLTISPDTLAVALAPGTTVTRTLTIGNAGHSDLEWAAELADNAARRLYRLPLLSAVSSPSPEPGAPPPMPPTRSGLELSAELRDLSGVRILWDISHGQESPTFSYDAMINELVLRGAEVTVNEAPLTPALLAPFAVVWLRETYVDFTSAERAALVTWLRGGGGLLLEGDESPASFNAMLAAAGAGITYGDDAAEGTTTAIHAHATTVGVGSLYLSGPLVGLSSVVAPAGLLAEDANGRAALAWSRVLSGRVVALCDEIMGDYVLTVADNRLFGNQVFDWLAGVGWLKVDPAAGIVTPGSTEDVTVTFDAARLCGGAVSAGIVVTSNDPVNPLELVPAFLDVIGQADLTIRPAEFAFGPRFVGTVVADTLTVINDGCEPLTIDGVTSDQAEFTATPAGPFTLAPGTAQAVAVRYVPVTVGPVSGTLIVASDDPDEPAVLVPMSGAGLEPPVVAVAPAELTATLVPGGSATRTLTIGNAGRSELAWSAAVTAADAMVAQSRGARFAIHDSLGAAAELPAAEANGAAAVPPPFAERVYSREPTDLAAPRILLLATYDPTNDAYGTALRNLGLGFTLVTSWSSLEPLLTAAPWDLVIVNNYASYATPLALDRLASHLDGGGALIYADWNVYAYPSHDLLSRLGVSYRSDVTFPLGFAAVNPSHRGFRIPNTISSLRPSANQLTIDGQLVTVAAGARQLAAFQDHPESGAVVLDGSGRGVFNAFQSANFNLDDDGDGLVDMVEFLENEIVLVGLGAPWLRVEPDEGVLPAGASQDVTVTFDAKGLCGIGAAATVSVVSNDPVNPELAVPATLVVTGEADLASVPTSLAFGRQFVGVGATQGLSLTNAGCDQLAVSSVTSDQAVFSAYPPVPFIVPPGATVTVTVGFLPTTAGAIDGTLTITSNDPDEPAVLVALSGTGVAPPAITVAPDTLAATAIPGSTATRTLTIGNTGGSDLTWTASAEAAGARLTSGLRDLTGVRILWDTSHGQLSPESGYAGMVAELESRGAQVDLNVTRPLRLALLAAYDILWIRETAAGWTSTEVPVLTAWLRGGGGLLLEGDGSPTPFNELLAAADAGIAYGGSASAGTTTAIGPHATTVGVASLYLGSPTVGLSTVAAPAGLLAQDASGRAALAWSRVGSGRVVAFCDDILEDASLGHAYNRLFGNRVFDWLSGPGWLQVEPAAGVVPAGESRDVTVTFDATNRCGGAFAAQVSVTSDDPLQPGIIVPARLDVLGDSDIAVAPAALAFGAHFAGAAVTDTLIITSRGCEPLTVSGVTCDQAQFTATPAGPFTLAPAAFQRLMVTFAPATAGAVDGLLSIASDDPDEPVVLVPLSGTGVPPPVLTITPDTLAAVLNAGETATRTLTLGNTGLSELTWTVAVGDTGGGLVVEQSPAFRGAVPGPLVIKRAVAADVPAADALTELDRILVRLDAGYGAVTGLIPDRFGFTEGVMGWSISDGGADMYDGGNFLMTNLGGYVPYLNGQVMDSPKFGTGGRYFTRKYPGLFVLVADLGGISSFNISGDLGANGHGAADGAVLESIAGGRRYLGFVKRVFNAGDPSVNHLVIVEKDGSVAHNFATDTNSDWHEVTGLESRTRLYYLLYATEHGGYIDNAATLRIMEAFLAQLGQTPEWLRVTPPSGSIAPGASQDLTVTFDATGLCGGRLAARLTVTSNDPTIPVASVPARLDVAGEPDISVAPASLDFGARFPGSGTTDTLVVTSRGCVPLTVVGVTSDQAQFTAIPTGSFTVAPGASQSVFVTYTPTSMGAANGQLTIASDDPDEPALVVALSGMGVGAPAISVAPDTLAVTLAPGGTATRTLTIGNTGFTDLAWSATVATRAEQDLTALTPATTDLSGVRIMWDASHQQGLPGNWADMVDDLASYGAEVLINSQPVTAAVLDGVDVFWTIRSYSAWQGPEITALVDWWRAGGGLLLEGDSDLAVTAFNTILTAAGAGIAYGTGDARAGLTTAISPHASTAGITSLYLNSPLARLATVAEPAQVLVQDPGSVPVMAWSEVAGGRVMAASDELFNVWGISQGQNRQFGGQVFGWLAGSDWARLAPSAGVVPAGATRGLTVTCSAAGLPVGIHTAVIDVTSNDPLRPAISIPVRLTVRSGADAPTVTITAALGASSAGTLTAGVAAGATDGYDVGQDLPATEPGASAVSAWFPHAEWQVAAGDRFRTDLRAPWDELTFYKSWRFRVAAGQAGQVVLSFVADPALAPDAGLRLVDRATGLVHDLRAGTTYAYSVTGPETREFTLRVGDGLPAPDPVGRGFPSAWSMVAISLLPPSGTTLQEVLLSAAPFGSWLFGWEPAGSYYHDLPGSSPCLPGQGMWLYTPTGFDWTMAGTLNTAEIAVPLAHGWTLVGYPLWFGGDLAGTVVEHAGVRYAFAEAVARGLVAGMAFGFDDGGVYRSLTGLEPWHAYWVASYVSDVTLRFAHTWMEDPSLLPTAYEAVAKRQPTDWRTTVRLDGTGAGIVLGQSEQATDGFDAAWDLPAPPPSPSPDGRARATISLPRPAWPAATGGSFLSDVRAAGEQPLVFVVRVSGATTGVIRLSWECGEVPAGRDLEIRCGGRTLVASMRAVGSVELTVGGAPLELEFATPNGPPEAAWIAEGLHLRNRPNPFNPSTTFQFNLETAGDTRLLIYDTRGTLVQEIRAGQLSAGPASLHWNGIDRRGRVAPSGMYLYRLFQDGRQLGGTRKMVLLK